MNWITIAAATYTREEADVRINAMISRVFHIAQAGIHMLLKRKGAAALLLVAVLLLMYASFVPSSSIAIPDDVKQRYNTIGAEAESSGNSLAPMFESPVVIGFVSLLSLVLLISTVQRTAQLMKARPDRVRGVRLAVDEEDPRIARVLSELRRSRYRWSFSRSAESICVSAEKGSWGGFGSVLFHFGLLTVIAGITYSTLSVENESILLTEGESFRLLQEGGGGGEMRTGGSASSAAMNTPLLRLVDYDSLYAIDDVRTPAAIVETSGDGVVQRAPVHINAGLAFQGRKVHLGPGHGFSPYIHIVDPEGNVLVSAFIRIAALKNGKHRDYLELQNGGIRLFLALHGVGRTETESVPRIELRCEERGRDAWSATLGMGATQQVRDYTVTFPDMREWVQLDIADTTGPGIVAFGALIGLCGLVLRLFLYRKNIRIRWDHGLDGPCIVEGNAEYFTEIFFRELEDFHHVLLTEAAETPAVRTPRKSVHREDPS
ncbi:MAG: cytochrome c biogenesis protein ResB [Bacteroidetes bacterium]|nr:cytochrome c biogenesis protein ResB [Bacteroidota bacterium]